MSETPKNVGLFQRPMPQGYREELQALMAEKPAEASVRAGSLLLFQLGRLHLAIPTSATAGIAPVLHLARIPHRSGTVLLGLAAWRGQILPCCSLARLLGAEQEAGGQARTLILEERPGQRWAVPVDSVLGVRLGETFAAQESQALASHWLRGELREADGTFAVLDPEVLFRQMKLATA